MDRLTDSAPESKPIVRRILVLALLIGSLALVTSLDLLLDLGWRRRYGIYPRDAGAWAGIFIAPWLHGSFGHLSANIGALTVLGWFCLWPRIQRFLLVTFFSILGSGLLAWLFGGRHTVHIGASGIVFGYFGYLLARGWYERTLSAIVVSLGILVIYSGMVWGILPGQAGISWQCHLGGFLAGLAVARFTKPSSPGNRPG